MAFKIIEVQKALKGVDYPTSVMKALKGSLTGSND
jgi:hypothetical protein